MMDRSDEPKGERPAGLTALALLAFLDGLMRFVGGWGAMGAGGAGVFTLPLTYPADPGAGGDVTALLAAGFVAIVVGVLELAFAWGAWNQADWAWLLGLGAAALALLLALGSILFRASSPGPTLLGVVVPLVIGAYLLLPGTRRAFGLD
jgi:hypothetical protein